MGCDYSKFQKLPELSPEMCGLFIYGKDKLILFNANSDIVHRISQSYRQIFSNNIKKATSWSEHVIQMETHAKLFYGCRSAAFYAPFTCALFCDILHVFYNELNQRLCLVGGILCNKGVSLWIFAKQHQQNAAPSHSTAKTLLQPLSEPQSACQLGSEETPNYNTTPLCKPNENLNSVVYCFCAITIVKRTKLLLFKVEPEVKRVLITQMTVPFDGKRLKILEITEKSEFVTLISFNHSIANPSKAHGHCVRQLIWRIIGTMKAHGHDLLTACPIRYLGTDALFFARTHISRQHATPPTDSPANHVTDERLCDANNNDNNNNSSGLTARQFPLGYDNKEFTMHLLGGSKLVVYATSKDAMSTQEIFLNMEQICRANWQSEVQVTRHCAKPADGDDTQAAQEATPLSPPPQPAQLELLTLRFDKKMWSFNSATQLRTIHLFVALFKQLHARGWTPHANYDSSLNWKHMSAVGFTRCAPANHHYFCIFPRAPATLCLINAPANLTEMFEEVLRKYQTISANAKLKNYKGHYSSFKLKMQGQPICGWNKKHAIWFAYGFTEIISRLRQLKWQFRAAIRITNGPDPEAEGDHMVPNVVHSLWFSRDIV